MEELFSISGLFTLLMLILLQAVLGFDNLLYISIESKRVEESKQAFVRRTGIGMAMVLRIVLLIVVVNALEYFKDPWFQLPENTFVAGAFTLESIVTMFGGAFILYTAVKEIMHMLSVEHIEDHTNHDAQKSVGNAIFWIVLMNLVFSFDSILSAMALTKSVWLMSIAIIVSGLLMIFMADHVAEFLKKNRLYEVLGLFILFIVGVMLLSEGGHQAHLAFFTHKVEAMEKSTFYFVIAVLVVIDIVQGRYQRILMEHKKREIDSAEIQSHAAQAEGSTGHVEA